MNNNLAPITLQDDETFVENIKTKNALYIVMSLYGIVCIVLPIIVMYRFKIFLKVELGTTLYFYIALCLLGVFIMMYYGLRLKKAFGTKYFLTSKRLYVKLSINEEYQAFTKDDIKSVYHKKELFSESPYNFGLLLELNNGEILHLSSLKKAEKLRIQIADIMNK